MYQYDDYDRRIIIDRAQQFRGQVGRRLSGEITEEEFKPLRLQNGLYMQLHAYMLRVAIPYGLLSATQVRKLAHIARTYDRGYGHLTTRQNIQYNWPKLTDVPAILDELASVEMHAVQTSGNCVRNITSDHFAGVARDELEDPRPYCEILRQWSTFHPEFAHLPRKFKIAVTGAPGEDRAAVRFHDIGLRIDQVVPRECPGCLGGGTQDVDSAGQFDQFRIPMTTVEERVDPFEERDTRALVERDRGGPPCHGVDSCAEPRHDLGRDRFAISRGSDGQDGVEHLVQGHGFQVDHGWVAGEPTRRVDDLGCRDGADIAQRLGHDQVWGECLERWDVQVVERVPGGQLFPDKGVDLVAGCVMGNERRRRLGQVAHERRVVALVRDTNQVIPKPECADDLGRTRQEGHDLHLGDTTNRVRPDRGAVSTNGVMIVMPSRTRRWLGSSVTTCSQPGARQAVRIIASGTAACSRQNTDARWRAASPHIDRARRRRVSPSGSDGFGHGACVVLPCQFAVRGHALLDLAAQ